MDWDAAQLGQLIDTALGREKADLAIVNASLVNVYTGKIEEHTGVAIKGERIACVGPEIDHTLGPDTQVIDAQDRFIIPGFIDAHTHIDAAAARISEIIRLSLPTGTTAIVTETSGIGNVLGISGILRFIDNLKDQPILVFVTCPSQVPISPAFESSSQFSPQDAAEIIRLPEVVGVGEAFWTRVLDKDPVVLAILQSSLEARKPVQGHSAGAKNAKLQAYAAAGIASCHEPITVDEALQRLRLGMHVMIRDGSIRHDLEAIAPIKDCDIDMRRLILVSDTMWLPELISLGYMDYVVQKAIDLGFAPVDAIRMATLNPAEHFHLDMHIGGIAPYRYANINIIPDLKTVRPEIVLSKGHVVAAHGKALVQPREDVYPSAMRQTIHLPRRFQAEDFYIRAPATQVKARVINIVRDMITSELQIDIAAPEGYIFADVANDILKATVINRHNGTGEKMVGLVKGFGLKTGAYAMSFGWDAHNICAVGVAESDIAAAVNRIYELQGGVVLCENGVIYEEIPLPVAGIISDLSAEEIVRRLRRIDDRLRILGSRLPNPYLSLQTLVFTPLPFLRITERGLVDVRQGKIVELFV